MNSLVLSFFFFVLFSFVSFFLPGYFILFVTKASLSFLERCVLSFVAGILTFTGLSFLLGSLGILQALPIILLSCAMLGTLLLFQYPFRLEFRKAHIGFLLVLGIGIAAQLMTVVRSGSYTPWGLSFWGPNFYDGILHLSIIGELQKSIPPQNPIFAGFPFANYHYFSDLTVASFVSLWQFDVLDAFFRFFPFLLSALYGLSVFILARRVTKHEVPALLAVFLSYLGGSFGYIPSLIKVGDFGGESMFWSMQSASYLLNPPFAFSVIFLLCGILCYLVSTKDKNFPMAILASVFFGFLVGFKVYAAVLVLPVLLFMAVYEYIREKSNISLSVFVCSFLFSLPLFLSSIDPSVRLLEFQPFWFLYNLPVRDHMGWFKAEQALFAYQHSGNVLKLSLLLMLLGTFFFIGNLGMRIFFVLGLRKWFKRMQKDAIHVFLFVFFVFSAAVPLLFVQKGTPWNTIQFFYYFLLLANILAADALWGILRKRSKIVQILSISLFLLLSFPTTIGTVSHYKYAKPHVVLPVSEERVLTFLKDSSDGTVLTAPYSTTSNSSDPRTLFQVGSSYVSAFSQKPVYLEDVESNRIQGRPIEPREKLRELIFSSQDPKLVAFLIHQTQASYVYLYPGASFEADEKDLPIELLIEDQGARLYRVI